MAEPLPSGYSYSKDQLERVFHLGIVFSNPLFVDNIYTQLNYIQYMGRMYGHWELTEDLKRSFCQNYLILVASLMEALIRGCYSEKLTWCETSCVRNGGLEDCPFATRRVSDHGGATRECLADGLSFKDLLEAASEDGILNGLNIDNLNALRKIRNQVHIDAMKSSFIDRSVLNPTTINSYLKDLKSLIGNAYDWLMEHLEGCFL